jgi:predicted transcriptional regulator
MGADLNVVLIRSFAVELKLRRAELGISQEQLALRAEINRTFVGKIETGRSQPTLSVLYRLIESLECDFPDFWSSVIKRYRKESHLE